MLREDFGFRVPSASARQFPTREAVPGRLRPGTRLGRAGGSVGPLAWARVSAGGAAGAPGWTGRVAGTGGVRCRVVSCGSCPGSAEGAARCLAPSSGAGKKHRGIGKA